MSEFQVIEGERIVAQEPRIKLTAFNDLQFGTKPRYLVSTLIPLIGLSVIWGPPKCGKSFWAFDMLMHVALGREYRGLAVQEGAVVYCAFEGQSGFGARAEAFRQRFLPEEPEPIPFYLVSVGLDLVTDHVELIEAIRAQIGDTKLVAVALDTLNRSLRGSESSDEDMAAWVKAADAIKEAFDCATIAIHHCGHEGTRPRGHSSLTAAADVQIKVSRDAADNIVAEVECAKDGPQGHLVTSRLEVVDIGVDDDDAMISSCIVVEAQSDDSRKQAGRPKRLPRTASIALRVLGEALSEVGVAPPHNERIPRDVRVVTTDMWRRYCYQRGISTGEERAKQKAFRTAYEILVAGEQIKAWGEHVWLPESPR